MHDFLSNPLLNGPRRIDARPEPLFAAQSPTEGLRLSEADILAARTPAGAWTRHTLAGWGVAWPPPKGWKERLLAGQAQEPARTPAPGTKALAFDPEPGGRTGDDLVSEFVAGVSGYAPNPDSPGFDSRLHGLLAPPRVTCRRRPE